MLFNYLSLILCISTLSSALPLEGQLKPRALVQRAKSYSIVNVDGGSTAAPPEATTILEEKTTTRTVKVTAVPTVTSTVITTVVDPTPAPAPTLKSSSTTASASHTQTPTSESTYQPPPLSSSAKPTESVKITETLKPSIVTVVVTAPAGPTEYYDNGMWHTSYVIKSFEAAAVATPSPSTSSLSTPTQAVSSTQALN